MLFVDQEWIKALCWPLMSMSGVSWLHVISDSFSVHSLHNIGMCFSVYAVCAVSDIIEEFVFGAVQVTHNLPW